MGVTAGPAEWWTSTPDGIDSMAISCPLGTVLPDGSAVICRAGGAAWIVAPFCTEVTQTWNGTTNTQVLDQPCVTSWSTLCSTMIACGFNPSKWFVPSVSQLQNPGYLCRDKWDNYCSSCVYWSSTEVNASVICSQLAACFVYFSNGIATSCFGGGVLNTKVCSLKVRAFRCVNY